MNKKILDAAVLSFLVILAVVLFISTFSFSPISKTTTALYVRFLGIALFSLSATNLVLVLINKTASDIKIIISQEPRRLLSFLFLLIAYITSIQILEILPLASNVAFFISSMLFIPITTFVLGYKNLKVIGLTTVAIFVIIFVVFVQLLMVPLP